MAYKGTNTKLRLSLMRSIKLIIEKNGWTQAAAAEHMGVARSRISMVLGKKVEMFSTDSLINMLENCGFHVSIDVTVPRRHYGQSRSREQLLTSQLDSSTHRVESSDEEVMPLKIWAQSVKAPSPQPIKVPLSVRLDDDVLSWLKSGGRGYQSRMNAILREAMLVQKDIK